MADNSTIEWTDATWNPIRARNKKTGKTGWHCEHATTGCEFCYSEGFNKRLGTGLAFKPGHRGDIDIFLDETMLTQPLRWQKPRMIFVCSMTDLFADFVSDEWIDKMFAVMALCPQHTFQVLTKRAARMREYFAKVATESPEPDADAKGLECVTDAQWDGAIERGWPLPYVWLGVSTERQQEADERIPLLLQTPAAIRFISAEPLLGPIDLPKPMKLFDGEITRPVGLDWVIVGGESGPHARPMHPAWGRELRDQCAEAGVAFFFKQWGEWHPRIGPEFGGGIAEHCIAINGDISSGDKLEGGGERPRWIAISRVGKKAAGRKFYGLEHNAMPRPINPLAPAKASEASDER